ncbi:MAG UNVERIFIED_CONTAM: hypothetical protein LVR29_12485 [Microcystis novacekii LVE1205-3]
MVIFPVSPSGNSLLIYDPESIQAGEKPEICNRSPFSSFLARNPSSSRIADFFAPQESGIIDVFPMQAVTVGKSPRNTLNLSSCQRIHRIPLLSRHGCANRRSHGDRDRTPASVAS